MALAFLEVRIFGVLIRTEYGKPFLANGPNALVSRNIYHAVVSG
jgi:hypothetical protein